MARGTYFPRPVSWKKVVYMFSSWGASSAARSRQVRPESGEREEEHDIRLLTKMNYNGISNMLNRPTVDER